MRKNRELIIVLVFVIFSIISGLVTKDLIIGGITLLTAILCSYYSSVGKSINYLFGILNCILVSFIGFKNNLYGLFIFYFFIFMPLQIVGYLSWKNNKDEKNNVIVREFTFKNSIIITLSCIFGSFILAYLLKLIPTQELAFLDASSNILNLCAFILMLLRFKECWWIWLVNNLIDLTIWIINVLNNGNNSFMMLIVSIMYLLINIYGIIKWQMNAKK